MSRIFTMSIAVSVTVKPSRLLFALTGAMCVIAVSVAPIVYFAEPGQFSYLFRAVLSTTCVASATVAISLAFSRRKTWCIDISGIGNIRLMEYKDAPQSFGQSDAFGRRVWLAGQSTLWPWCLFLHLRDEQQKVTTLLILKDSLPAEAFRALTVACRWIAEHNE